LKYCSKKQVSNPMPAPDKLAALASLRRELAGKVRSGTEFLAECERRDPEEATALAGLDAILGGGFKRGRLTEIHVPGPSRGGGLVLASLLARARQAGQYAILFDVGSGFSVESFPERDLESLLWVGCDSAAQAVSVWDVAARDDNFRWFLLDGRDCTPEDWRAVRPAQWQRIVGQMREREAVGVVFARGPVTAVAKDRLELVSPLGLESLHQDREAIVASLRFRRVEGGAGEKAGRGEGGERRMAG
jgi:hypothetical protein